MKVHQVNWSLAIAIYLFVAGAGAAAYYTGVLADIFSGGKYWRAAKYGSYLGVPLMLCGILMLLFDLGRPARFWTLLFRFQSSSVMSIGVWLITLFVLLAGLHAGTWLTAAEAEGEAADPTKEKWAVRQWTGLVGIPVGMLTAAYTGVLLAGTSRLLWDSTSFLGLLFLLSATSTGIAALMLILAWQKAEGTLIQKLARADAVVIIFESIVFVLLFLGLSSGAPQAAAVVLKGSYALPFWFGAILCGLVIPLVAEGYHISRAKQHSTQNFTLPVVASICVLLGGFLLRYVLLFAGQVPL